MHIILIVYQTVQCKLCVRGAVATQTIRETLRGSLLLVKGSANIYNPSASSTVGIDRLENCFLVGSNVQDESNDKREEEE